MTEHYVLPVLRQLWRPRCSRSQHRKITCTAILAAARYAIKDCIISLFLWWLQSQRVFWWLSITIQWSGASDDDVSGTLLAMGNVHRYIGCPHAGATALIVSCFVVFILQCLNGCCYRHLFYVDRLVCS